MSMQIPLRRPLARTAALAAAIALSGTLLAVAPSSAMANVVSKFTLAPTSTTAGSEPSMTTTLDLSYSSSGDSIKNISVTLPPGLLAAPGNVPQTCSASELTAYDCPAGSQIGIGTATTTPSAGAVTTKLFIMPASGSDLAGLGAVLYLDILGSNTPVATARGTLGLTTVNGQPAGQLDVLNLPHSVDGVNVAVSSMTLTINGKTSAGTRFTRLPSSCAPATTTVSVDTYSANADGSGSSTFSPTDCGSLPYAPAFSASAVKDKHDSGVSFTTVVSQANPLSQAASKVTTLIVPTALLAPNSGLLAQECADADPAECPASSTVGTVKAQTPLIAQTMIGRVVVVKGAALPGLTIVLTSPAKVEIPATVTAKGQDLITTFPGIPDIPLSQLNVTLSGGTNSAFQTLCSATSGVIGGKFTGQNGVTVSRSAPVKLKGCPSAKPPKPGPPKLSGGSLTGVGKGKPRLRFTLAAGKNSAPKLSSFSVSLGGTLGFVASGLKKGLAVRGGSVRSSTVSGGRLVVKLKSPSNRLTLTVSSDALSGVKSLQKRLTHHLVPPMLRVTVTEANGKRAKLSLAITQVR